MKNWKSARKNLQGSKDIPHKMYLVSFEIFISWSIEKKTYHMKISSYLLIGSGIIWPKPLKTTDANL